MPPTLNRTVASKSYCPSVPWTLSWRVTGHSANCNACRLQEADNELLELAGRDIGTWVVSCSAGYGFSAGTRRAFHEASQLLDRPDLIAVKNHPAYGTSSGSRTSAWKCRH
jgi:hypothetical protein